MSITPRSRALARFAAAVGVGVLAVCAVWVSWLGVIAGVLIVALAVWEFRSPDGVDIPFSANDWCATDDDEVLALEIPYKVHGVRSPVVTTYERGPNGLSPTDWEWVKDDDHNVRILRSPRVALAGTVHIAA